MMTMRKKSWGPRANIERCSRALHHPKLWVLSAIAPKLRELNPDITLEELGTLLQPKDKRSYTNVTKH